MKSVDNILDRIFYSKSFERIERWVEVIIPPPQFAAILFFAIMGILWAFTKCPCLCR
jgi:hypothetical protein